ncbi:MAG: polysaccharide deacetylase family protein [Candidatus Omnitrophota bacterium]|nr:polysaccharide deacetylase family protein [Candidatus Omnitrophota bacterium]MDZ4241599.1 polysaccharide deacetylase family protein [Candidatus Omnitrophota bacterium]
MRFPRALLFAACGLFVLVAAASITLSGTYTVPVMMYHHVAVSHPPAADYVSPENFRRQMAYLKQNGYKVIRMEDLVNGVKAGKTFPPKTVVLSFDDGYIDNYKNAMPVLQEFGFPAIFFVSPNMTFRDGFMRWSELVHLRKAGFDFGSHGMTQAYLPGLSAKELEYEVRQSKRILETRLKMPVRIFAYPVGGFTDDIKAYMRDSGYLAAATTNRGKDRFDRDIYEINRIRFSDKDVSNVVLWMKLSGHYNLFRKLKQPY